MREDSRIRVKALALGHLTPFTGAGGSSPPCGAVPLQQGASCGVACDVSLGCRIKSCTNPERVSAGP